MVSVLTFRHSQDVTKEDIRSKLAVFNRVDRANVVVSNIMLNKDGTVQYNIT